MNKAWFGLALLLIGATNVASLASTDEVVWRETSRDVYIDGVLDPGVRVLRASEPTRYAVQLGADAPTVAVLPETGQTGSVAWEELELGEHGWRAISREPIADLQDPRRGTDPQPTVA